MTPRTQAPPPPGPATLEHRFRELEAAWTAETQFISSYTEIVAHPAFREIIRMGAPVVPWMLRDLKEQPRLWVWALPEITGANPVPPEDSGNIAKMSQAWLRWGAANGY